MYNEVMGMGEKNPKNIYTRKKTRKNPLFGFPPIPPSIRFGRRLFSGSKETRNKPDLP